MTRKWGCNWYIRSVCTKRGLCPQMWDWRWLLHGHWPWKSSSGEERELRVNLANTSPDNVSLGLEVNGGRPLLHGFHGVFRLKEFADRAPCGHFCVILIPEHFNDIYSTTPIDVKCMGSSQHSKFQIQSPSQVQKLHKTHIQTIPIQFFHDALIIRASRPVFSLQIRVQSINSIQKHLFVIVTWRYP